MKQLQAFIIALFLFTGFISCEKETTTPGTTSPNSPNLPSITTVAVSGVVDSNAISGGNITSDGGAAITARGVCWGTSPAPTITGNHTADGSGTGTFQSNISGLTKSAYYYVRAYATNSAGTAYGNEQVFATPDADVYVVGNDFVTGANNIKYRVIKMWKNGVMTQITNASGDAYASAVYVSGNDVYIAGYENEGNKSVAKVWKNGVATSLSNGTNNAYTSTVFVAGTDVYVGGSEYVNNKSIAKIWKNGIATSLNDASVDGNVSSIYVSGTDVYACGGINNFGSGRGMIWKNGTVVANLSQIYYFKSIAVSGNDIYAVGDANDQVASGTTYYTAKLYKNGVVTSLPNLYGGAGGVSTFANSVFVSGPDIYVAGGELVYINSYAGEYTRVWKNGVILTEYTGNKEANSVYADNGQVYVAGRKITPSIGTAATVWKNGVASSLVSTPNIFGQFNSEATSVFVK